LRDGAPVTEPVQENAPMCHFFLPMMSARPILYVECGA
jgi:hypothetical protein